MKVHVLQIPARGLHLEGEEPAVLYDLANENTRPIGPVRYGVEVGLSKGGLFATGWLEVELELRCVHCLRRFRRRLRVDAFACQVELAGRELVDLTPLAREDIVLALPPHPRCDWNGKTRCEGVPLPAGREPDEPSPVWDVLNQVKTKSNQERS